MKAMMSKKKATAMSNGIFLISLGVLFYTNFWWPGILFALWITLASRQYWTGRLYDAILTTVVLLGLFCVSFVKLEWAVIIPVLFIVGGIFIVVREYYYTEDTNGEEKSEEIKEDVDLETE